MTTAQTEMQPITVSLKKDQIAELIYQQLEDDGGADWSSRHAIAFAIEALDRLGLIVRTTEGNE